MYMVDVSMDWWVDVLAGEWVGGLVNGTCVGTFHVVVLVAMSLGSVITHVFLSSSRLVKIKPMLTTLPL